MSAIVVSCTFCLLPVILLLVQQDRFEEVGKGCRTRAEVCNKRLRKTKCVDQMIFHSRVDRVKPDIIIYNITVFVSP